MSQLLPCDHAFTRAVREGDLQEVRRLLADNPSLANAKVRGDVSFRGTVWRRDGQRIPATEEDRETATALHFAAFHGKSTLAKLLLEFGANVDAIAYDKNFPEATPVVLAAWEGDAKTLEILLSATPDLQANRVGETALHAALEHGAIEKAALLIKQGVTHTIHTAAMAGDIATLELLLDKSPELLECQTQQGLKPLQCALMQSQCEAAEFLIERGAIATPEVATALGYESEILALIESDDSAVSAMYESQPLLHWAIAGGQLAMAKLLLQHGADPDQGDRWEVSPLRALSQAKLDHRLAQAFVDLLVDAGANIDRESRGFTPLAAAIAAKNEAVINSLRSRGAAE